MNAQQILGIARKYISGIDEIQTNVYKGTLTVAEKPAGIYYFDLNNKPLEDFDAYQERLLADDFYSQPGNMQWNYYLFLLNDQLTPSIKENIEKNDKYARKYVLTEAEFNDFFTFEKSAAAIRPNIVAEWKRRLDEVGLHDVYSSRTYVDLVSQFKSSGVVPPKKVQERRSVEEVDKISFITRVMLHDNYRPYPLQRDFKFGKVNLFRGINGVGKTSLFEAIEAMLCGRCLRNPRFVMPQGCIQAEFNGNNQLINYDGGNNRLFVDRDLNWYATNSRNNTLFNSFNRFNFFNADAAHNFSIAATEKDASDALFSIVLGPEYHYISERNVGTLDRLRPEFNRLKEDMQGARQRKQRTDRIIQNYKEPASLRQLRDTIQSVYHDISFKKATTLEDFVVIEERNNRLRPILTELLSKESVTSTRADFNKEFKAFEEKRRLLSEKEDELRTLTEKHTALNTEQDRLDNDYKFLSRCIIYIQDEQLMKLDGLQTREGSVNLQKNKISIVKDLLNGIESSSDSIKMSSDQLETLIDALNRQIKSDEEDMTKLLNSLGQLESLVQQIKSHGREFISLNHDASECPLCQAIYERPELEHRISQEPGINKAADSTNFDTLRHQIEQNKKVLQEGELALQQQRKLKQGYSTAFPNESFPANASAYDQLLAFINKEEDVLQESNELSQLRKYAETSGYSEKEYNEIKVACSRNYPGGPAFEYGERIEFEKLLKNITVEINNCKTANEQTVAARTLVGNEIKRLLGVEGSTLFLKDIRDLFQKEENDIMVFKNALDKLENLIDLNENKVFNDLLELAETLQNNIASLREEQKIQFEYDVAKKENSEALAFIAANEELLLKYERAVETLRALTGDEASAHVSAFFDDNFQEIVDIFKSIHVPKEFKTLKYFDDRLELVTNSGETRSISQISTGQRSALALSIFLSLNGKLSNGPDIIMFDDPVAFIDDLNALSFLDHLRVQTLKSGRQIFFATANMRLASLFEKKFGFLGDDFKGFPFERPQHE